MVIPLLSPGYSSYLPALNLDGSYLTPHCSASKYSVWFFGMLISLSQPTPELWEVRVQPVVCPPDDELTRDEGEGNWLGRLGSMGLGVDP